MVTFYKFLLIIAVLSFSIYSLQAAYLKNIPQTIKQPDGTLINCLASGDEFYNWLHDADGYTIIQDKATGYYSYARQSGDSLIPTKYYPWQSNPAALGFEKWLKIAPEKILEKRNRFYQEQNKYENKYRKSRTQSSKFGTIQNLVVFIRFAGESEFSDAVSTYDNKFNSTSGNTVKSYYYEASYQRLTVQSSFYPTPSGSTVISYQDSHQRGYFQPYSPSNTIGYQTDNERAMREQTLLKNAVDAISSQVPTSLIIDNDSDGLVDNVCFVIYGSPGAWGDCLWPHKWTLYLAGAYIRGIRVWDYNFVMQTAATNGVLCHEFFHSLGAPDLYRYQDKTIEPVGPWDIMAFTSNPPQHMGAYMKMSYGTWITSIPLITQGGTYSLNPLTSSSNNCYKINSPNTTEEYFIVEYRKKTGSFDNSLPASGLIISRIRPGLYNRGNVYGPPDEVYIYRPYGTNDINGDLYSANYSSDVGRTAINDQTNPSGFLSNGNPGGLCISNISSAVGTISFEIKFGPLAPKLTSPQNNAPKISVTPKLEWQQSEGAQSYSVQISTSPDFSNIILSFYDLTGTYINISSGLSYGGKYYWRVNAKNSGGTSDWSTVYNFSTIVAKPNLMSPVNNSIGQPINGILQWGIAEGATSYNLKVYDTELGNYIVDITNINQMTYTYSNLRYNALYRWEVQAINSSSSSDWSDSWNFKTIISPPDLLTPDSNSCSISTSGILIWHKVKDANSYNLQLSTSENFKTTLIDIESITDTTYPYNALKNNTIYYWRVSSKNTNGTSPWSIAWKFTTFLKKPNLLIHQNNSKGILTEDTLSWHKVEGASFYRLEISKSEDFSSNILTIPEKADSFYVYTGLKNKTKYYWRLQAYNANNTSQWSDIWNFTTILSPPSVPFPVDSSDNVPLEGTFIWSGVPGAEKYWLQVSVKPDFSIFTINDSNVTLTSYDYKDLWKNTIYYWRLKSYDSEESSIWTKTWLFTTQLTQPILLEPEQNSTGLASSIKFVWEKIDVAESYNFLLSESPIFLDTLVLKKALTDNFVEISGLNSFKEYYWRVNATILKKNSPWSETGVFSTSLFAPILNYPNDNEEDISLSGYVRWLKAGGAQKYSLQISLDSNFNNFIIQNDVITDTSFSFYNLPFNTKYYWRVKSYAGHEESLWSEIRSFTTSSIFKGLLAPANNSTTQQITTLFKWRGLTRVQSYGLQISEKEDFSKTVLDTALIPDTTLAILDLHYNTKYYWRINCKINAAASGWCEPYNFTTALASPIQQFPPNDAKEITVGGKIIWTESDGAKTYYLMVSENNNFSNPIINESGYTQTNYIYSELKINTKYYWKVKAESSDNSSSWSDIWSFTTKNDTYLPDTRYNNDYINLKVHPNPASNSANINFEVSAPEYITLNIFDIYGNKIAELIDSQLMQGNIEILYDTEKLPSGVYYINLIAGNKLKTERIIIIK